MPNQFTSMSMDTFYSQWGRQIDTLSRQIAAKTQYDFSLKGKELTDDAVARAWLAMPKFLAEYDPSVCPLMPYLGQRLNWLFATEKRNNAKRGQWEVNPDSYQPEGSSESDGNYAAEHREANLDYEALRRNERRREAREALRQLQRKLPAGKYRDCLDALVDQLRDESVDVPARLHISRQHVHNLKTAIPEQVPAKLANEIRDLLRHDDSATSYAIPNSYRAAA